MSEASYIKGWCPGALRPMESGDGLIVRLRVTGGTLTVTQARAIANASEIYGNGLIDLSSRANLQIRGVTHETWPKLIETLSRYDLVDQAEEAESVRNVMASPLAGLDPTALINISPLVKALEDHLKSSHALHQLPAKFGFLIDDGGAWSIKTFSADINFEAIIIEGAASFAVRLAGAETISIIHPHDLIKTADTLAHYFIDARRGHEEKIRRMNDLVARDGAGSIFAALGLTTKALRITPSHEPHVLGFQQIDRLGCLSLAAPFGRWQSSIFSKLIDFAEVNHLSSLRLSPWRALILPGISKNIAEQALSLFGSDLITDPHDPRLSIAACSGAPHCLHASVETQKDARALSALFKNAPMSGISLHVSGCEKGCAHPRSSKMTLVGRRGLYDLVINGKADDPPRQRGLDPTQAVSTIKAWLEGDRA